MEKEIVSDVWAMSGWIISYTAGVLSLHEGVVIETPLSAIKNAHKNGAPFGTPLKVASTKKDFKAK